MSQPRQLRLFDLLRPPRQESDARRPQRRPRRLRTRGRAVDLSPLVAELNERFFEGALTAAITWGRRRPRRRRRRRRTNRISLQLGSYNQDQDLVRVHPALDQPWVPRFVLEAVIYHELLHAAMPPTVTDGRRRLHTPEFRRRERLYPRLDEANAWVRENLQRLIAVA